MHPNTKRAFYGPYKPFPHGIAPKQPVEPIRIAVEEYMAENDLNWAEMAYKLGFIAHKRKRGDGNRLRRRLGLLPLHGKKRGLETAKEVRYETAVFIIREIGRAPWEFGI